jgi:hypothetical protein
MRAPVMLSRGLSEDALNRRLTSLVRCRQCTLSLLCAADGLLSYCCILGHEGLNVEALVHRLLSFLVCESNG